MSHDGTAARNDRVAMVAKTGCYYVLVAWHHADPGNPVLLYFEVGPDGYDTRRVDVYADGRTGWADGMREAGDTMLSEVPMSPLAEINAEPECTARIISSAEFETVWVDAQSSPTVVKPALGQFLGYGAAHRLNHWRVDHERGHVRTMRPVRVRHVPGPMDG